MEIDLRRSNQTLRGAAMLFFLLCLPLSMWGEMYVASKIFVPQDPVMTAKNLLQNDFIFRTSIVAQISGIIIFVYMFMLFYTVFSPVDTHLGRLMMIPLILHIGIVFVFEVCNYAALMILKSEARSTFTADQQQEVAFFLLRMYRYGMAPTKFFLGLSFVPLGMLLIRSQLAPKIIGIFVIVSGFGYIVHSLFYFLLDRADYIMFGQYARFAFIGFLMALIWMLIKGLRPREIVKSVSKT